MKKEETKTNASAYLVQYRFKIIWPLATKSSWQLCC